MDEKSQLINDVNDVNDDNKNNNPLQWDIFYDIIMNDKDIDYILESEIFADLGKGYSELTNIMPNWGMILHTNGNMLSKHELLCIFKNGLLLWYVKYFTTDFFDIINLISMIKNNINIDYYHFVRYVNLCKKYNINISSELIKLTKFKSYQKLIIETNCDLISFKLYMITNDLISHYENMIDQIIMNYKQIIIKSFGKIYEDDINFIIERIDQILNNNVIFDFNVYLSNFNILDKINNIDPFIFEMGIIFQRWKIVVEKLSAIISMKNIKAITIERLYNSAIIMDRILTRTQEIIFYHTKKICINIIKEFIGIPDIFIDLSRPKLYGKNIYKLTVKILSNPQSIIHNSMSIDNIINFNIKYLIDNC